MLENAMVDSKKKAKYLTKTVKFGDKKFTLFSLDGVTWSSRRDELHQIIERQEQERKAFNQIMGDQSAKPADGATEEEPEKEDEKLLEAEADEILPIEAEPQRTKIKPRLGAGTKALPQKSEEEAPKATSKDKKKAKAAAPIAAPKARASSKPAKKMGKAKGKKRAA